MESDPVIVVSAGSSVLPEGLVPLWREGLARPETDYQRGVCESIVRAHHEGFAEMSLLIPDLRRVLTAESTHPVTRFAAARALIALDDRDTSAPLWDVAGTFGGEFQLLIEPALAEWEYEPARDVWVERLQNPDTRRRKLILAAECAATTRASAAVAPLVGLAVSREQWPDVRLAAARAAGSLAEVGLEEDADHLASGGAIVDRLCAVSLLTQHSSPAAQRQLLELAIDEEPSIAAAALAVLLSIDPNLVLPIVPQSLQSDDAVVRLRAAQAYMALPTSERVAALSALLDDRHIDVRTTVRDALLALADQPDLDAAVRGSTMQVLHEASWRGQEQAALLLAALDYEPAAARMIELLDSERPEVMIATAWGLRTLAVPDTASALLDQVERQTEVRLRFEGDLEAIDSQVAHLFEALGLLDYKPAEPMMRRYVPKNYDYGELSRAAAVWALGHVHAGEPDDELAAQLMARATDEDLIMPEYDIVREMSIISIGRMQAGSQLSRLHALIGPAVDRSHWEILIAWAIEQISGQRPPDAPPVVNVRRGWFLEPLID